MKLSNLGDNFELEMQQYGYQMQFNGEPLKRTYGASNSRLVFRYDESVNSAIGALLLSEGTYTSFINLYIFSLFEAVPMINKWAKTSNMPTGQTGFLTYLGTQKM